jgi:hypothetical protein
MVVGFTAKGAISGTCIRKCNTKRLCFIIIDIHQQFYFNLMIKLYIFSLILGL